MSKAVLTSIQPKWCEKIANGEKTIEVRKTKPKLVLRGGITKWISKSESKKLQKIWNL